MERMLFVSPESTVICKVNTPVLNISDIASYCSKKNALVLTNDSDFATTAQVNALDSTTTGTGAVVTNVSQTDGKVSVTKGNVQIPVGGESATTYAKIWVE